MYRCHVFDIIFLVYWIGILLDTFNVIGIFVYIKSIELVLILDFKYILLLLLLLLLISLIDKYLAKHYNVYNSNAKRVHFVDYQIIDCMQLCIALNFDANYTNIIITLSQTFENV